jgi:hypothetical protein
MGSAKAFAVALGLLCIAGGIPAGGPHLPAAMGRPASADPGRVLLPALSSPSDRSSVGGATGRLVVSTADGATMPNSGLRTNITGFAATPLPADTSFQVSVTETIGGFDAVFGIFQNQELLPVAFFSVFNNSTDTNVHLAYWTSAPLEEGEPYDFELVTVNATYWELTVNGAEFAANDSEAYFDFGADEATWLGGLLFTEIAFYSTTSPVPAFLNVPLAFAVRGPSGWTLPEPAAASFTGSGGSPWGIEGRDQHPTLAPGELDTGTSVAPLANGTELWSSGEVPVRVGIILGGTTGVATTPFLLSVVVDDSSGAPIPGVSLFVGDSLGGYSLVFPLITNGTGGTEDAVELPNVSASTSDLLQAVVTSFGYTGTAGASVEVTPAPQLFLTPTGLPGTLAPGAQASFSVMASEAGGAPVSGAFLQFSVLMGGEVTPTTAVTDSNGEVSEQLIAASVAEEISVIVTVTGGGAWGHASFTVDVRTPAPSFWSTHGSDIELGVGLGIAALLVGAIAWRVLYRRRRPLPPSHGIRWGDPAWSPAAPGAQPPPTRRPPSGGDP